MATTQCLEDVEELLTHQADDVHKSLLTVKGKAYTQHRCVYAFPCKG